MSGSNLVRILAPVTNFFPGLPEKLAGEGKKSDQPAMATSSVGTTPNTTVDPDGAQTASDKTAARVGRAALISTSPEGVLGTSPTGRRKLLGN